MLKRLLKLVGPPAKPIMRRYWQFSRGVTLGVRCVAFDDEKGVCLVRHTYVPGWSFPGGGVEHGETVYDAGERELREETGIIQDGPAKLFGNYANQKAGTRDHVAVLISPHWHQAQPKQPDLEIAEAAFFPLAKLPDTTTPSTRARLAEIFQDKPIDSRW